jgi:hypothetical protein
MIYTSVKRNLISYTNPQFILKATKINKSDDSLTLNLYGTKNFVSLI